MYWDEDEYVEYETEVADPDSEDEVDAENSEVEEEKWFQQPASGGGFRIVGCRRQCVLW